MKKGFTIVEVLVVIAIVAILTVIIFPSINNIRAKNRDAEKVADIATIQLGLALYKSQNSNVYPETIFGNPNFTPKYAPADSLVGPDGQPYDYVPLAKNNSLPNCTYYHLGTTLELSGGQINTVDTFDTTNEGSDEMNKYWYCTAGVGYSGPGIPAYNKASHPLIYAVHP